MYKSTPCDARRGRHNISCCMCPKHTFISWIRRSKSSCPTGTSNHCNSKTYVQTCHNGEEHAEHHGLPLQPWHLSIGLSNRNTVSIRHASARSMPLRTDQYIMHDPNAPGISAANLVQHNDLRACEAHPAVRADRPSRTMKDERGWALPSTWKSTCGPKCAHIREMTLMATSEVDEAKAPSCNEDRFNLTLCTICAIWTEVCKSLVVIEVSVNPTLSVVEFLGK